MSPSSSTSASSQLPLLLNAYGNLSPVTLTSPRSSPSLAKKHAPRRVASLPLLDTQRPGDYYLAKYQRRVISCKKIPDETNHNNTNSKSKNNDSEISDNNTHREAINKPVNVNNHANRYRNSPPKVPPPFPPSKTQNLSEIPSQWRPKLGDLVLSLQLTDDDNSQFEGPENLLSISSSSIVSPSGSPEANQYVSGILFSSERINEEDETSFASNEDYTVEFCDLLQELPVHSRANSIHLSNHSINSASHSTIILRKPSSLSLLYQRGPPKVGSNGNGNGFGIGNLKAASTSQLMLKRTKSKYMNSQEVKERQQIRKKMYDENDDDSDLHNNDLELVFNVPVIRSQLELFIKTNRSHMDLMLNSSFRTPSNKSQTHVSLPGLNTLFESYDEHIDSNINNSSITENSLGSALEVDLHENDSEISELLLNFYIQTLENISKLVKEQRTKDMMYKLPAFVRLQSLIDDVLLMSPQKLNVLDHTRPINLPPKSQDDIEKHNKELRRCLEAREAQDSNLRKRQNRYSLDQFYKQWLDLDSISQDQKEFSKKLYNGKNSIRGLNWKSNCPDEFKYNVYVAFLTQQVTVGSISVSGIEEKFDRLLATLNGFADSVVNKKDTEYYSKINETLLKPFFASIVKFLEENNESHINTIDENSNDKDSEDNEQQNNISSLQNLFKLSDFKKAYRDLLYIQSMNDEGLQTHDSCFLIPSLLFAFPNCSIKQVFVLLELINFNVFNKDLMRDLNIILSGMLKLKRIQRSYGVDHSDEFENLDGSKLWKILLQMGDVAPSSLSAPSTPVTRQMPRFSIQPTSLNTLVDDARVGSNLTLLNLELLNKLIQSLVIYVNSSSPKKFQLKVLQSLLLTLFKYYHFGWNTYSELLTQNITIKLSKSTDPTDNLFSFLEKWNACLLEV